MSTSPKIDLKSKYRNKRVLVTGHTGFKGGWLSFWLAKLGSEVTGFSNEIPTKPSFYEAVGLKERVDSIMGDVRDLDKVSEVVRESRPDYIFHLAAQPLVRRSYDRPVETFDVNVMGTVNVMEAARESRSLQALVCITSDKCYENDERAGAYRETDRLGGKDPYSASKGAAEIAIASYRRSFYERSKERRTALVSARAGNVIGGGDWAADRIVPDCIRALSRKKAVVLRDPGATRPWQHVLEPLSGYLILALKAGKDPARYNGAWNFGPAKGQNLSVEELVKMIIEEWGEGSWRVRRPSASPPESHALRLDCTKARDELDWRPVLPIDRAIKMTVSWYKEHLEQETDMARLSGDQIKEYSKSKGSIFR
ncbi:MAG: CDP-glucose 4,6-dehydratase [Methanomassiliicoccales archaeon]|nr:CDP-glucose 4,6-dehydratase [Methanomassiliicoccales archaeon]